MKLLFIASLLVVSQSSFADYDSSTYKTTTIHCQGSEATLDVAVANGALKFALGQDGKVVSADIAPENDKDFYNPGADIYGCEKCASSDGYDNASWLSVGVSIGKKTWVPVQHGCLATRSPVAPCFPTTTGGDYEPVWLYNFDLMLTQTAPGTYTFSHMEYNFPEGKAEIKTLGANTTCQVSVQ